MSEKYAADPKSASAAFARVQEAETAPAVTPDTASGQREPRLVLSDPHPSWAVPTRHRPDLLFPAVPPDPVKPPMTREAFDKARSNSDQDVPHNRDKKNHDR